MNIIKKPIKQGENQTVEFKISFQKERYGSGIKRIKDECLAHGVVEPLFEEFVHGFRVILYKEKINVGINELYDFIRFNQAVNTRTITENFDKVTKRTIEGWIKQLKDDNKIEFIGSPKTGGWYAKK